MRSLSLNIIILLSRKCIGKLVFVVAVHNLVCGWSLLNASQGFYFSVLLPLSLLLGQNRLNSKQKWIISSIYNNCDYSIIEKGSRAERIFIGHSRPPPPQQNYTYLVSQSDRLIKEDRSWWWRQKDKPTLLGNPIASHYVSFQVHYSPHTPFDYI